MFFCSNKEIFRNNIIYYYVHLHIRQCLAKQLQKYVAGGPRTPTAPGTFFVYQ